MNKYESITLIGRGSFGTVVQVQRKADNEVFAIKQIQLENEKVISLAESEVKVLQSLNHPCIVRYIEYYIHQENAMASNLCIVLEYCSNGTLHQLIHEQNGKHFSEKKILDWLAQLAWALETVHSRNIIHRDLKPQNILVDKHWTLKLADFGLCKVLQCDQSKATPTLTGTQQYMAPEVLNNTPYNAFADIWSLGCVLYELMEFRPAFECNGNVIQLMEMIKSGKYHAARQTIYSEFLMQLVADMINVNTESRPEARQLLAEPTLQVPLENLKQRIQNLESSNRTPQQDLAAVEELSVEIVNKCAIVHESSVRVIADDTPPTHHSTTAPCSNESTSTSKSRLTDAEMLQFTYEGMSPVEANAAGFYQPFNSQEGNRLKTWKDILKKKVSGTKIALLPPLLLNTEIIDKVPIVVDAQRRNNEFWIWGAFHSKVSTNVLPMNVQLDLSLTFTKADNTNWTVEKQIIATVEHKTEDWFFKNPLFILYDVPFSSFTSPSAPGATNISIRRIAPEQKWFYCGLAPLFGQNGNSFTIDCNSLNGTYDSAQEWKKMVENGNDMSAQHACLSLPPLLLASGVVGDVAVCVIGRRIQTKLRFGAKLHSSMPEGVNSCEMRFKMACQVRTQDKSDVTKSAEKRLTLTRKCTDVTTFINFPWSELDSSILPCLTFSILPL